MNTLFRSDGLGYQAQAVKPSSTQYVDSYNIATQTIATVGDNESVLHPQDSLISAQKAVLYYAFAKLDPRRKLITLPYRIHVSTHDGLILGFLSFSLTSGDHASIRAY